MNIRNAEIRSLSLFIALFSICFSGICFSGICFSGMALGASKAISAIEWRDWSAESFQLAREQNKPILLNLEAVWCHWCHVMDQKTYADPSVAAIISQSFIAIKVDHDARPDLANRYRDFGWPATIFLDKNGVDLVKRAGFIKPENFIRLLSAVAEDPTPERAASNKPVTQYAAEPALPKNIYNELLARHRALYDPELGGLKTNQKTLDRDHVEFALMQAKHDPFEAQIARKTVEASFALQDPVWGGIYQYSTFGDWQHPHFEKIMASQAGFMRIYALAYQEFKDPKTLQQAELIAHYIQNFLTAPDGTFYTSQDADLIQGEKGTAYFSLDNTERRKQGIPRVDQNIYARENGWMIEALAMLFEASNNRLYLNIAERAATGIITSHLLDSGGYRHHSKDINAQHLGDSLNMAAALLQLHKSTGNPLWLKQAELTAGYIIQHFTASQAGFLTGLAEPNLPIQPTRNLTENIKATRLFNLLAQYLGSDSVKGAAEHGMRYLATEEVAFSRIEDSGILIAATEMAAIAPHYTVVGSKSSSESQSLFSIGLNQSGWYKRLEWWDKTQGPLRNSDVTYPSFDRSAGFVCVDRLCSAPAFNSDEYQTMITRLLNLQNEDSMPVLF